MKKFPALIALLCIFVYAGSLVYGAYRVYTSVQNQKKLAVKELNGIQNRISSNGSDFYTQPFRDDIKKSMAECTVLQGIIITGPQGNLGFEKEAGAVIRNNPNPGFIPRFGYAKLQARPINIPGSRNVNIYSVFNAINYENLVLVLRQTLFAILCALLLSFLTMMITILRSRSSGYAETSFAEDEGQKNYSAGSDFSESGEYSAEQNFTSQDEYTTEQDNSFSDVFNETEEKADDDFSSDDNFNENFNENFSEDFNEDFDDSGFNTGEGEEADFSVPDSEVPGGENNGGDFELPEFDDFSEKEDSSSLDDDFHLNDFIDEEDLSFPESTVEEPAPAADTTAGTPAAVGASSPNGLYSPRSNLGWEAYTEDRLASELHRCASSEQDLVVLLMECGNGVNCDAKLYRKIADEAVELFNLHDLTFEYGERGITVIIPNAGLEQGIAKAEAFHSKLFHSYYDFFRSKNDFLTGITSRSGRLIEADRLLQEAKKALEKAKIDEDLPIAAFKSDPEKYRNYIRKSALQD